MSRKNLKYKTIFFNKKSIPFFIFNLFFTIGFCHNLNAQIYSNNQNLYNELSFFKLFQNNIAGLKIHTFSFYFNRIEFFVAKLFNLNNYNLTLVVIGLVFLVVLCLIWILILNVKYKKTLGKFSKNNQKLKLSQKATKVAFIFWNFKTHQIENSPELKNLFHLNNTKATFPDKLIFDSIHPADYNKVNNALKRANTKAPDINIEFRIFKLDGLIVWVHLIASFTFDNWGKKVELAGTLIDITEKKNTQDEALDRKKRLERAEQIAQLGNWVLDLKTNILTLSSGAGNITGIENQTIALNDFKNAIIPLDKVKFQKALDNLIYRDKPLQIEIRFRHFETNELIHLSNYGIIDNNSQKIYVVSQDVTEKHRLERQFIYAFIEAQETEKQTFGEDLHDGISQILAAESMYIDVLLKKNKNGKNDIVNHLTKIRELNLSAINEARGIAHGLMSKQLKEVGLIKALENICVDYNNSKSIEFTFTHSKLDENEISKEIKIHIFRITQEISTNIIRHSLATKAQIILTKNNLNLLCLIIKDNGIGIDFEKIKKENKGAGIKNIERRVTLLNGTLNIDTEPNQGTCFTIEAPLYVLN